MTRSEDPCGGARSFDPQRPLDRPTRHLAGIPREAKWGRREFAAFLRAARAGRGPDSSFAAAVSAEALLRGDTLEVLLSAGCNELHIDFFTLGEAGEAGEAGAAGSRRAELFAGLVARVHAAGVRVYGGFTLGLDEDDPRCFERLVHWVEAQHLFAVELRLWTPDPGSDQTRSLVDARRVVHCDLHRWDGAHVVVAPAKMSAQTLYRGWAWCRRRLRSPSSRWRRRPTGRSWAGNLAYLGAVSMSMLAPAWTHGRVCARLLRPGLGPLWGSVRTDAGESRSTQLVLSR